jgi:2-dehydro-3-deoxygluconokinase
MSDSIDIISIGECLIELSTDESIKYAEVFNKYFGGDTINTAVAAARMGSKVGYITRIGNDSFKDYLIDAINSEGINTNYIKLVEGTNGLYLLSRLKSGEKEFAYYRKKSAATSLSIDDIDEDYIGKASIIYATGITQALSISSKDAVKKMFSIAKEKQCKVAYDPNFRPKLWSVAEGKESLNEIIEYTDIIFLSEKLDGEKLLGISSPDKLIKHFWDLGVQIVVVKNSDYGSTIGYNGEIRHIPAYNHTTVDVTGAGDAYNGGFLHGLVSGYTAFESGTIAAIVAGLQVQGLGAIRSIPYRKEVLSILEKKI